MRPIEMAWNMHRFGHRQEQSSLTMIGLYVTRQTSGAGKMRRFRPILKREINRRSAISSSIAAIPGGNYG